MGAIGRVGKWGDAIELRKSTVFVDNLPNGIRKGFVFNLFSRFGKIRDCYIPDKKSKRSRQNFGFVRFESIRSAFQAVESTDRSWIWGRELVVNVARFVKKQGGSPTQFYGQYNQKNLEADVGVRNQWGVNNQHPKSNSLANKGNALGNGKEVVIYQHNARIQRSIPTLKDIEKRGNEAWRRKGVPESSKKGSGSGGRSRSQEDEVQDGRKSINVQAVGNGWLNRSAVGKVRRLTSAQDLVSIFKNAKMGNVLIKPMGGRYMVVTFPSEDRRNEVLKEKWLELWFEEVKPWNGEAAKDERFVWIACYGMPLNTWNIPSFRAIGSSWGCFIEVDNDTLREVSYSKGRILIATENPNKIEGEVQLIVNGRNYIVRVEEEDTFRTISSTNLASHFEVNPENEEQDVEMGSIVGEMDDIKNKKQNSVGDRTKINEEEAKKFESNCINDSKQTRMEKERVYEELLTQRKSVGGKHIENLDCYENSNEESFNSEHGLESIVQDYQNPLIEDGCESVRKNIPIQNADFNLEVSQDQEKEVFVVNSTGAYESNVSLRASQMPDINLHIELNPSDARRSIRSQQFDVSESTEEDELDGYIMGSQEHEQDAIEKELQNTIVAAAIGPDPLLLDYILMVECFLHY